MTEAGPSTTAASALQPDLGTPFWQGLEAFADRTALKTEVGTTVTYAELAARGDSFARSLPPRVALIALEARNEIESIIAHVGCLRAGRPVLLLSPDDTEKNRRIVAPYRPEATYSRKAQGWTLEVAPGAGGATPHPDLAVLLSTSGSTGNPKVVRLSRNNIASNASAITSCLGITADDRAVTTLCFHFSYGMAVLHSHLAAGATVLLTERAVVDEAFWEFAKRDGATSLAFVPYHFDLVEKLGLAPRLPPTVRSITVAGGRVSEDRVRKYVRIGDSKGFKFTVMYGQTEASPRMAYLPHEEAMVHAGTVGRAIPGGRFEIRDEQDLPISTPGVQGELIYRGPNVMMGYAETRADLARGVTVHELHTGDVAALTSSGHVRIAGRLSRFLKLYGVRINLDDVEEFLDQAGHKVACLGDDNRLVAVAEGKADARTIRMLIGARHKVQPSHVTVLEVAGLPRSAAGKIDYAALAELAEKKAPAKRAVRGGLREAMAVALSRKAVRDGDTFTTLGGDSLAFLEVYLALERQLGHVPARWETKTIVELEALAPRKENNMRVPFNLLVRLAAVAEVIGFHTHSWTIGGGAFVLLALAGYSMSQFQRANIADGRLGRIVATMFPRLLVAYFAVIIVYWIAKGGIDPLWLLALGNFAHEESTLIEPLWFIPAYLQVVLLFLGIVAIPAVRSALTSSPWRTGMALLGVAVALRAVSGFVTEDEIVLMRSPLSLMHLFLLGWCMQYADTHQRKAIVAGAATAIAFAFWHSTAGQSVFIALSCAAVLWIDSVTLPRRIGHAVTLIGSASFFIYIVHMLPTHALVWVFPLADYVTVLPVFAVVLALSVALGVAAHVLVSKAVVAVRRLLQRRAATTEDPQLAPEW